MITKAQPQTVLSDSRGAQSISIQELLKGRNPDFDRSKAIKLVRHAGAVVLFGTPYPGNVADLYRDQTNFIRWQNHQKRVNFHKTEYIVVFISTQGTDSLFVGVYRNNGITSEPTTPPESCFFDFEEVPGFDDLKENIVVKWDCPRSWHQWYKNKKIVLDE